MATAKELNEQRGSVYGPFLHNAIVAQNLKMACRQLPGSDNIPVIGAKWDSLPTDVREALDLIMLKVSRILTGDPEYLDNWDDIAGYARCVSERIRTSRQRAESAEG